MELASALVFLLAGFGVLLYSGDCLVRGALAASYKANVSPLLVGVVIVGFGTSLPELIISVVSAMNGRPGLAQGAIVGSNIANIWLVLALPAIIFPISTRAPRIIVTALVMMAATIAWVALTRSYGLSPLIGSAFLAVLLIYVLIAWMIGRRDLTEDTPEEKAIEATPAWRMAILILIGVVGLPLGSRILVDGGIFLSEKTEFSQETIGLTLLAIGSSLPELGAGMAAAWRRQSDVAMGNILGANIFNLLGAGGVVALTGTYSLSPEFHDYSHWLMAAAAAMILLLILLRRRIGIGTALVFLACYAAYITGLVNGWTIGDFKYLILERPV
ncbi:MAG: sodium:calcium antiporter [Alphaproteobacteria bacterium]|nr:sodium:calcium antiporter [Alphaproteobacteria bacterium]